MLINRHACAVAQGAVLKGKLHETYPGCHSADRDSQGIVIPKPSLAQIGLEGHAEMTIERDALVLRRPAKAARTGWAAAAQKIAALKDVELVQGEFGNEEDAELRW